MSCPLVEVHNGQTVYPIESLSDEDTIVAECNGKQVEFGVEDLRTLDGEPLSRTISEG